MIPVTTVARGDGSRIVVPRRVIVRTPEEWRALWAAHAGPDGEAPAVDFGTAMIAAAFAGERPTPGYAIEITGAMEERHGLRVFAKETRPPAGLVAAQVLTAPFHIVRLARSNGEVHWGPGSDGQAGASGAADRGARSPRSTSGLSTPVASALAYLVGPVSGALILLAEQRNPTIRFHAWQSILAVGGAWLIVVVLYTAALASLFISAGAFAPLLTLSTIAFAASIVLWLVCLVKAYRGSRFKLPYAGVRAERRALTTPPAGATR
jgi:uncharacterized membrane protein